MAKRWTFIHNPLVIIIPIVLAGLWGWNYYIKKVNAVSSDSRHNLLLSGSFDGVHTGSLPSGWSMAASTPVTIRQSSEGYGTDSALLLRTDKAVGSVDMQTPKVRLAEGGTYTAKHYYRSSLAFDILLREQRADGTARLRYVRHFGPSAAWTSASVAVTADPALHSIQLVYRAAGKGELRFDSLSVERDDEAASLVVHSFPAKGALLMQDGTVPVAAGAYLGFAATYRADAPVRLIADYTLDDGSVLSTSLIGLGPAREATLVEVRAQAPPRVTEVAMRIALQGDEGWLQAGQQGIYTLTDKSKQPFNQPMVSLVIADGRKPAMTVVPTILSWSRYPGTFYIDPALIGSNGYASEGDLRSIRTAGNQLALFESSDLSILGTRTLQRKISLQRGYFSEQRHLSPLDLYAPYDQGDIAVRKLAAASFNSRLSSQFGINTAQNLDSYALQTVKADVKLTVEDLRARLEEAKARKGWVLLVYDRIEANKPDSVAPQTFFQHLEVIKKGGIPVVTVQDALRAITMR